VGFLHSLNAPSQESEKSKQQTAAQKASVSISGDLLNTPDAAPSWHFLASKLALVQVHVS
jgi:hypothetical protein